DRPSTGVVVELRRASCDQLDARLTRFSMVRSDLNLPSRSITALRQAHLPECGSPSSGEQALDSMVCTWSPIMPTIIQCPSCDSSIKIRENKRGQRISCPRCAYGFRAGPPPIKGPPPLPVDADEPYFTEEQSEVEKDGDREAITERPRKARSPEPVDERRLDGYDHNDDKRDKDEDEFDRPRR